MFTTRASERVHSVQKSTVTLTLKWRERESERERERERGEREEEGETEGQNETGKTGTFVEDEREPAGLRTSKGKRVLERNGQQQIERMSERGEEDGEKKRCIRRERDSGGQEREDEKAREEERESRSGVCVYVCVCVCVCV